MGEQSTRVETDSLGPIEVPSEAKYGAQTQRSRQNFKIGGQRFTRPMIRALGIVKKCAALANVELGELDVLTEEQRAALLKADRRPLLYGLKCSDATPAMGSAVLDGETPVGRITAGARSPTLDCGIGYVRFGEAGEWSGRALHLRLPDGKVHPCEIVDLPFLSLIHI